ncbi:hypothetical protein [Streptomyces sp. NPDC006668]|uniref:hypothetical protein n=1 Tax=Streptomyces sp. NPDC006668 TaxID=3156903 RepID=UPI0033E62DFC
MRDDDRPYDPMESARQTLRDLGHVPGPEPVRQLRQLGAQTLAEIRATDLEAAESSGESALAYTQLLEAAVSALGVHTEAELDGMEQAALADAFGLHPPEAGRE